MQLPIRIFVASTPAEWLPARVLEFSMIENCAMPIHLTQLHEIKREIPEPKKLKSKARTPFSFQRFLIPEACQYDGKAIYLDADMLVFQDISEVWNTSFEGSKVISVSSNSDERRGQFSVMLLNCESLDWNVDEIVSALDTDALSYEELMFEMRLAQPVSFKIGPQWNSLESYTASQTALLHYTDMNTQPWISTRNPLGHLWVDCLRRSLAQGFVSEIELDREIKLGHVRPSLRLDLSARGDNATVNATTYSVEDLGFVAPYRALPTFQRFSFGRRALSFVARRLGLRR
jgi:lipopolysaccharide biosynthesis glycosyltransferase